MYCGKTNIPLGVTVKIVANSEGNLEEPFLGLTGIATMPHRSGCCDVGWIGVVLHEATDYGRNINVHVDEIIIIE